MGQFPLNNSLKMRFHLVCLLLVSLVAMTYALPGRGRPKGKPADAEGREEEHVVAVAATPLEERQENPVALEAEDKEEEVVVDVVEGEKNKTKKGNKDRKDLDDKKKNKKK